MNPLVLAAAVGGIAVIYAFGIPFLAAMTGTQISALTTTAIGINDAARNVWKQ